MTEEASDIDIRTDPLKALACHQCGHEIDLRNRKPFSDVTCPGCGTVQKVPVRLGSFYLLEPLGRGGMGAVYKALDQTLGRYVAIKVMRKELGDDQEALKNFLNEARAAAALNHPNVVQIYSCGQEKGQPYIVMEMVGGGRLDALMAGGKALDEIRVMQIAVDVAKGLGAASEVGLVHGDIKPQNILFGADGTAKVADFGLARFVASQQGADEVWGTPYYVAPERVHKQPGDHRSDIYSLGATLFHALSGEPPFDAKTANDVVRARLEKPAPDIRSVRKDIHEETVSVLARMLETEPGRRYPTYKSLLSDLRNAVHAAETKPVESGPKKKRPRVGLWVGGIAALAIVGGLIFGGVRLVRKQGAQAEAARKAPKKWILVDGKLVPAPETEEEPVPVVSRTEPAPADSGAVPALPPAQPFSPEQQAALEEILNTWSGDQGDGVPEALRRFRETLPEEDLARDWTDWLLALVLRDSGQQDAARDRLERLRNAQYPSPDGGREHPGIMVRDLARFLMEDIDEIKLFAKVMKRPDWYEALATYVVAEQALQKSDAKMAGELFGEYAGMAPGGDATWPYALKTRAAAHRERAKRWVALKDAIGNASTLEEVEAAQAELAAFEEGDGPFASLLERERARLEQVAAQLVAQAEQQRAAHLAQVQQDLDRIAEARYDVQGLVVVKKFKRAESEFEKVRAELRTDEGKAWHRIVAEGFERMSDLKAFIIRSVQRDPLGAATPRELGGRVIGAGREGLRISLGGQAETVRPWDQISSRLFVWLANYYVTRGRMPDRERAARLLDIALYCYEGGGFEPAARYARRASGLHGELSVAIAQHMPGILAP